MKAITFYSYKGGVGRTLAIVNIAGRLAEFGKKVCVLDFDLEAPGLIHKYKHNIDEVKQGLVDYIYEFAVNGNDPGSICNYAKEITKKDANENNSKKRKNMISFIPAGNSNSGEYWRKLSRISWWNLFYEENSEGIPFFLDLKEKIAKEFQPDYLLIDTRTGITEISAITMSILADSIVLFAVNNNENICGTQRIIEAVTKEENNLLGIDKEIHFVLTRLPQITSPEEWARDEGISNRVKQRIEEAFQNTKKKLNSFNVIHSNKEIALYDRVTLSYDFDEKSEKKDSTPSISSEYLSLFDSLTKNDLSEEEKEKFNNMKRAEALLQRVKDNLKAPNFLTQLEEIEKIAPQLPEIYLLRGGYFYRQEQYNQAIDCFTKAIIGLDEPSGKALLSRGNSYFVLYDYQSALNDYDKYIANDYK
jgi:MinD-like ATPase involved in chromosome partitioning or flagellar assembly